MHFYQSNTWNGFRYEEPFLPLPMKMTICWPCCIRVNSMPIWGYIKIYHICLVHCFYMKCKNQNSSKLLNYYINQKDVTVYLNVLKNITIHGVWSSICSSHYGVQLSSMHEMLQALFNISSSFIDNWHTAFLAIYDNHTGEHGVSGFCIKNRDDTHTTWRMTQTLSTHR